MILRLSLLLCLGLAQVRCQSAGGADEKPDNLIDPQTMAGILTKVHLNEARVSKISLGTADSLALVYNQLHRSTLKAAGVDTGQYNASYTYYAARPALLVPIYQAVVDSLKAAEKRKAMQAGNKRPKP